jgi:nucleotide-binding universal stress UspA family protein
MFKRIMVPLDGSATAEQVLDTAGDLAKRAGATVVLAHADTPENYIYVEGLPVIDEQGRPLQGTHEREYLSRCSDRLEATWGVSTEVSLLHQSGASSAEMLAASMAETGIDLAAMTTHGRGGLERLWLGSVADQLVRSTHVPILLLRPDGSESILSGLRRVLVPLDGSVVSDRILPYAIGMADLLGAQIMLMRVVQVAERVLISPVGTSVPSVDQAGFDQRLEEAQNFLDSTAKSLPPRLANAGTHVAVSGHVAASIMEAAASTPGTIIAMTTHARTGLQRLFLGSVADKVLRASDIPMLLYKPVDAKSKAARPKAGQSAH